MNINRNILTNEEKYNLHWWHVLEKIKKELLKNNDSDIKITYTLFLYPTLLDSTMPNSTEEQLIISKLIKKKIIYETEEISDFSIGNPQNPSATGIHFYLEVNKEKFETIHSEYQTKIYPRILNRKNLLVFSRNGNISYYSPKGRAYQASLKAQTISYKVLAHLAKNPHRLFSFQELDKIIPEKELSKRQLRDAIQTIKNKLEYRGDELFKTSYGFKLVCDALLTK